MDAELLRILDPLGAGLAVCVFGGAAHEYAGPSHSGPRPFTPAEVLQTLWELTSASRSVSSASPAAMAQHSLRELGWDVVRRHLVEQWDRPSQRPLALHLLAASLPFAAYLTVSPDTLLERALLANGRRAVAVSVDDDVCEVLGSDAVVVKLAGCVTRPDTLRLPAVADDRAGTLIDSLLRVTLADRTVVVVGCEPGDEWFAQIWQPVVDLLGMRLGSAYVLTDRTDGRQADYWKRLNLRPLPIAPLEGLRRLLHARPPRHLGTARRRANDLFRGPFLESLRHLRSQPSESQVIDAFLQQFIAEVASSPLELSSVLDRAAGALDAVAQARPNFHGLRRLNDGLITAARDCPSRTAAVAIARRIQAERQDHVRRLAGRAAALIAHGDQLVVYSQSLRVIDTLRAVPRGVQNACRVYVGECRPRSVQPFADGLAICEQLAGTGYEVLLVPDVAIATVIERQGVGKILLGAHAVYVSQGRPTWFINTCGSAMIVNMAAVVKAPVFVIAERNKAVELDEPYPPAAALAPEEDLSSELTGPLTALRAMGLDVRCANLGFDLCRCTDNVRVLLGDLDD